MHVNQKFKTNLTMTSQIGLSDFFYFASHNALRLDLDMHLPLTPTGVTPAAN